MNASGLVSFLTDFGPGSVYVGQMHATLHAHSTRSITVIDLAHDCPFANVEAAGYILRRSFAHFPVGTVHVAVVDPGVGGDRRILAAEAAGHVFIAPDNGLLGSALAGVEAGRTFAVTNRDLMCRTVSKTFHGRDVFAPVAAFLACGGGVEDVGPPVRHIDPSPPPTASNGVIEGKVLMVDRFGNLITDVPRTAVEALSDPPVIRVRIGPAFIDRVVETFSDVDEGVALLYFGSGEHLEIAVNGGRASDVLRIGVGAPVRVERRP